MSQRQKSYWLLDNKYIIFITLCSTHLMKSVTVNKTITSNFKYRKTVQISAQRKLTNLVTIKVSWLKYINAEDQEILKANIGNA